MEKKFYVAPAIEIEQIAIEKGFASSPAAGDDGANPLPNPWAN